MIRTLLMIAGAGFVLAAAAFAAAFAIGGPDAVARGGWNLAANADGRWGSHDFRHRHEGRWAKDDNGPQGHKTLAWSGAERLDVDLPADIRFIQAPGPGSVEITGAASAVDRVILKGDSLRFDSQGPRRWWRHKLHIVVRAPNVSSFDLSGASTLKIEDYKQDKLSLDISGAAEVTAVGQADSIELDISGTGDADLGGLKAKGAEVEISGAGGAIVAPTDWARLHISGMGDIRLLTRPAKLETDISGAGRIRELGPPSEAPAPPEPPKPPPVKGVST
jgi:Putative auto-transporter adhesin, head GIN domain